MYVYIYIYIYIRALMAHEPGARLPMREGSVDGVKRSPKSRLIA